MFSLLGLRKSEPEDKCKLEDVVEGCGIKLAHNPTSNANYLQRILTEPVRGTDCALDDSEESVNNPVLEINK
jgi:hypothetical protein